VAVAGERFAGRNGGKRVWQAAVWCRQKRRQYPTHGRASQQASGQAGGRHGNAEIPQAVAVAPRPRQACEILVRDPEPRENGRCRQEI